MHQNITAHDILADLHAKLDKSKRTGDTLTARCPAHDDKNPSLSVKLGGRGDSVLVHCFAGCPTDAILAALGWTMRDLFASDDAWRSHEARAIGDDSDAAKQEASPLLRDTPGKVRLWIDALTDADLEGQHRLFHLIAESPEWAALVPALRIAVVGAIRGRTPISMATAILGRFDDRKMAWREPPTEAVDTSEPDVVSLATLLADPPDPAATVARGLAFGGTMGFIRGPKASGKTTILAAAAARVSRGQPWAGHPTERGTVLVVCNDDPRSWTLALRDFGADPERILMAQARVVSKPGKLAALLAEHRPTWVILDNLRTWCRAMQADTDNSSAAADAIDPIAEAIRECGYPVALTLVHNEARSKGVTSDPYAGRMRNSTVFEDAADWIVGCAHVDGSTTTTITCGEKTRRGIPTETLIIDLDAGGRGTPEPGGGGADPFTDGTPVNPLDEKITGYLMSNPQGVSQNAVLKAVRGARVNSLVARLKVVGLLGPDKLWRCACTAPSPPAEQVVPESQQGGGENRESGGVVPVIPANGNQGGISTGTGSHPIGEPPPGTGSGNHLREPVLLTLAGTENTPPFPVGGGQAKGKAHEKSCPKCFGSGLDAVGEPCDYVRPVEPVVHTGVQPISVEQRIAIEQTFVSDLPLLLAHFDGPLPSSPAQLADVMARELLGAGETWPTLRQTAETIPPDMWQLAAHAAEGLCNLHSEVTT